MTTVVCVRTGTKYPPEYVKRLKSMVLRHSPRGTGFVCLTDRSAELPADIERISVAHLHLPGWWAKMALFSPLNRPEGRCVYFDLDTVICGPLDPILELDADFAICANFARAAGAKTWPCRYGSCAMVFADQWGQSVYGRFMRDDVAIMQRAGRYGDQMAIEELIPDAPILQEMLPAGFFLNKRDFRDGGPGNASVLVFGGKERPDNTSHCWAKELWK